MQSTVTDELLADITRRIVERFHPRRILLFGSRARGDARSDSDIDLFIEMESGKRPSERAIDVLKLFGLRLWSMDVLVYTPEEVRRARGTPGSLVESIEAEGRVLHERRRLTAEAPRTHDLVALLALCVEAEPALARFEADCAELTIRAVRSRYPDDREEIGEAEARALVTRAHRTREAILLLMR